MCAPAKIQSDVNVIGKARSSIPNRNSGKGEPNEGQRQLKNSNGIKIKRPYYIASLQDHSVTIPEVLVTIERSHEKLYKKLTQLAIIIIMTSLLAVCGYIVWKWERTAVVKQHKQIELVSIS